MKFVNIIYEKIFKKSLIKVGNIFDCESLWLKDIQYSDIIYDSRFDQWKKSLNFFTNNQGVIRSRSGLPDTKNFDFDQRHPILLPSSNYFTTILIFYRGVPFPPTFLQSKKKKGKQREKRKSFKAEIIKRLSLRSNVTVLTILECLEFKTFFCRPTMVAENIFQCSVTPPL